jgi:hypothetical protein
VAYSIFFSSFSVWLGLLTYTVLANPIVFPSEVISTAFLISGAVAGVFCGIVGLIFLGVNFNLKNKQTLKKTNYEIIEEPKYLEPKIVKKKRQKKSNFPELETSTVNFVAIEETEQIAQKTRKRKKTKKTKTPKIEISVIDSLEKEITKKH